MVVITRTLKCGFKQTFNNLTEKDKSTITKLSHIKKISLAENYFFSGPNTQTETKQCSIECSGQN